MNANKLCLTVFLLLCAWVLVAGCGSDPVAPTDPTEDEVPVLPPTNVTATLSNADKLIISWDPNGHPQLEGYHVYRVEVANRNTVRMTPDPILETQYRDLSARRGVAYEYRVTATTKAGKESAYASATVMIEPDIEEGPGSGESRELTQ